MTPAEVRAHREQLGQSQRGLAEMLRLGPNGERTIRRWEQGEQPITGPASLALELLVQEKRHRDLTKKIDGLYYRDACRDRDEG